MINRMVLMICIITVAYGQCRNNKSHNKHSQCVKQWCQVSDTMLTTIKTDTFNVVVTENVYPKASWLRRNEGTILGAFLASLIALASILVTNAINKNQIRKEKEQLIKEKEIISANLLHSIYHELNLIINSSKIIQLQLTAIKKLSVQERKPIADNIPEKFDVDYLNSCRVKLLEYDTYKSELVPKLSEYMAIIARLNRYTDLKYFTATATRMTDEDSFGTAVESYFENLDGLFVDADEKAERLKNDILAAVNNLESAEIVEETV